LPFQLKKRKSSETKTSEKPPAARRTIAKQSGHLAAVQYQGNINQAFQREMSTETAVTALVDGANTRAQAVPRLLQIPQVEGEMYIIDEQTVYLGTKKWQRSHAKLFDSCFLLFANKNDDTPTTVFMVEDAVIKYDGTDLGGVVMNSVYPDVSNNCFSILRPTTGRKLWIATKNDATRDAWIRALLSTGSASIIQ